MATSNNPEYRPTSTTQHYTSDEIAQRGGTPWLKKLSWGAIFAGVLVSLVVMLMLNLLGIGIGLTSINPMTEQNPMSGVGTGAIVWWIVSNLIAIFAGAYIAARVAGVPIRSISLIHGLLSWCAYTLIFFWLLTTTVGSIISGVGSAVSQTISSVGSGIGSIVGSSGSQDQQNQDQGGINLQQITTEIRTALRQTGDPALQPDSIEQAAQQSVQNIKSTFKTDENVTNEDIQSIINQLISKTQNLTQEIDRQDVVNVVTARTNLSEREAKNLADIIVSNLQTAKQQAQELIAQTKEDAQQAAQKATDAAGSAAIWGFFALLIGMGASIGGGLAGTPKEDYINTDRQ